MNRIFLQWIMYREIEIFYSVSFFVAVCKLEAKGWEHWFSPKQAEPTNTQLGGAQLIKKDLLWNLGFDTVTSWSMSTNPRCWSKWVMLKEALWETAQMIQSERGGMGRICQFNCEASVIHQHKWEMLTVTAWHDVLCIWRFWRQNAGHRRDDKWRRLCANLRPVSAITGGYIQCVWMFHEEFNKTEFHEVTWLQQAYWRITHWLSMVFVQSVTKTGWCETAEMYPLTAQRKPKIKVFQSHVPLKPLD